MRIRLPSDEAVLALCSRAVSLYAVFEVWGEGATHEEVHKQVKEYLETHPEARRRVDECSFKFKVEGFNRHYSFEEQLRLIRSFEWMQWGGNAEMHNPQERFWILELVRPQAPDEESPLKVWLVRQLSLAARPLVDQYTLKRRTYLGTTSMEAEISFFTANQALVKQGSLIMDPFVGTGSLLVTCAALGAYTIGADIDWEVLVGKEKGKGVRSNFKQYGLEDRLLDLIRFDHSKHNVLRHERPFLDAIVCDPPYGIRAGAKKVGVRAHTRARHAKAGTVHEPIHSNPADPGWLPHVPQCVLYSVPEVLSDLLDFSARSLLMGGRLVYWLPTTIDYTDADLPHHPCFNIVSNSEQKLTLYFARRLITMEKVKEYTAGDVSFVPEQPSNGEEPAHANIAAKVTRQAQRVEEKGSDNQLPVWATKSMGRVTGVELKRMAKQQRKERRKAAAEEAAANASSSASTTSATTSSSSQMESATEPSSTS